MKKLLLALLVLAVAAGAALAESDCAHENRHEQLVVDRDYPEYLTEPTETPEDTHYVFYEAWVYWQCDQCGELFSGKPAPEEDVTEEESHKFKVIEEKPATCERSGKVVKQCTLCKYETEEPIPALGHVWGAWETVTAPEIGKAGKERRVCERDENHVQYRPINSLKPWDGAQEVTDGDVVYEVWTDGSVGATVKRDGITWLKEEAEGRSSWYGIDNQSGALAPGSHVHISWIASDGVDVGRFTGDDDYKLMGQGKGSEALFTGGADDKLMGQGKGSDTLNAGDDDDKLMGQGSDALFTGDGDDKLMGEGSDVLLMGDDGKPRIFQLDLYDRNGNEIGRLKGSGSVDFYVQLGDDWDTDDLSAFKLDFGESTVQEKIECRIATETINAEIKHFAAFPVEGSGTYAVAQGS